MPETNKNPTLTPDIRKWLTENIYHGEVKEGNKSHDDLLYGENKKFPTAN